MAKHASESEDKKFCVNLSAPFICEFFKDPLAGVLEYADVVIGNETEAETFAKVNGIEGSRAEVAKAIAALPYKGNAAKTRTVIITQASRLCLFKTASKLICVVGRVNSQKKLFTWPKSGFLVKKCPQKAGEPYAPIFPLRNFAEYFIFGRFD